MAEQRARLRLVVAAAGYGKTTALRRTHPEPAARWCHLTDPAGPGGPGDWWDGLADPATLVGLAGGARQLVLDDLPALPPAAGHQLLAALDRLPATVSVTIASRWPLPQPPAGPRAHLRPDELRLTVAAVAELLRTEYGLTDPALPDRLHDATAGWPALVHLAAETLLSHGVPPGPTDLTGPASFTGGPDPLLELLAQPGGLVASYLTTEVLDPLPPRTRHLIADLSGLAPVTPGLCTALGHPDARDQLRLLSRTGLLATSTDPDTAPRLVPLLATVTTNTPPPLHPAGPDSPAGAVGPVPSASPNGRVMPVRTVGPNGPVGSGGTAGGGGSVVGRAARWYAEHGPARAAARTLLAAGDPVGCARVLADHGDALVVTGRPRLIAELVAALPAELRSRRLRLLAGDALRVVGEVAAAAQTYEQVAAEQAERPGGGWDAALAWRLGVVRYLRGDQTGALACFDRAGVPDPAGADGALPGDRRDSAEALLVDRRESGDRVGRGGDGVVDRALVLAWRAVAVARVGDAAGGVRVAREAYRVAVEGGESALATVHTSLALCLGLTGDQVGSEEHYQLALRIAERTGDLVLLARILTNQSYHLVEQARYGEALDAARRAIGYAGAAGHANLRALATGNEADVLAALGRYDEAVDRYGQVLGQYRRMGSRVSAAALVGLGEVHRRRGWRERAGAAYTDALRLATDGDSRELAVTALAGLARAALPDDPATAATHATEAARLATDDLRVPALLAQGWVALATPDGPPDARDGAGRNGRGPTGNDGAGRDGWGSVGGGREGAARLAEEAVRVARGGGRLAGLAEALELRAAAASEPRVAREALGEAYAIWDGAGAVVNVARVVVARGRLPGASAEDRLAALVAVERLAAEAVPVDDPAPGAAAAMPVLRALGRFEVLVGGRVLPAAAWQSRRARDLLRILVVRRGRPVPRAELCELLWPDAGPGRTGHRLSVLLSIVRGVLDPGKALPTDHYLVADAASIALDVTHVRVDVLEFLAAVAHGRRLRERGATADARTVLAAADQDYAADVFSDEPYADWSGPLREQARAAHLEALRLLADAHRAAGAAPAAVGCLLRLLEADPYDEPAHRAVVRTLAAAGQHGEARRAFARYRTAMREIGVHPPDPTLLAPQPTTPTPRTATPTHRPATAGTGTAAPGREWVAGAAGARRPVEPVDQ
jgi:DNA-binding SARP family transcriptional activator/tetratricopeptide (TPR) repeat protein